MGTDCTLFTNEKSIYLDRWHTFSPSFLSDKIYSKEDFLRILNDIVKEHIEDYKESEGDEDNYLENKLYWCQKAKVNVGNQNLFLTDGLDEREEYSKWAKLPDNFKGFI